MSQDYEGGCLCGAIRFTVTKAPIRVTNCHCRICQRSAGAAFVTWAEFPAHAVTWPAQEPEIRGSSDVGERGFCPACGATLTFRFLSGETIDLAVAGFDDPSALAPADEIWTESRLPWMPADPHLPQHLRQRDAD